MKKERSRPLAVKEKDTVPPSRKPLDEKSRCRGNPLESKATAAAVASYEHVGFKGSVGDRRLDHCVYDRSSRGEQSPLCEEP